MLARRPPPPHYRAWNRKWSAPFGSQRRLVRIIRRTAPSLIGRYPQIRGPFGIQPNNDTRRFEYPWAYFATPLAPGMTAVEVGGGLSGFQFVLAREGLHVINVDPGLDASGVGWPCDAASIGRLNRAFRTSVDLRNTTLEHAGIADASVDRVFSISTIEHIPTSELPGLAAEVRRILKPGGYVVLTIDLFLDLEPFGTETTNRYGWNIDVASLVDDLDLELVTGDRAELNGYPEFDHRRVLAQLPSLVYGIDYPVCPQLVVLRKPASLPS